jgi:hypothetical protein
MLWVTFGYAGATEMAITVGANVKVENYFAEASVPHGPHSTSGSVRQANWGGERPARPFHKLRGTQVPTNSGTDNVGQLLLGAGKSPLTQLPERHFAAHGLAVSLA